MFGVVFTRKICGKSFEEVSKGIEVFFSDDTSKEMHVLFSNFSIKKDSGRFLIVTNEVRKYMLLPKIIISRGEDNSSVVIERSVNMFCLSLFTVLNCMYMFLLYRIIKTPGDVLEYKYLLLTASLVVMLFFNYRNISFFTEHIEYMLFIVRKVIKTSAQDFHKQGTST